MLIDFYDINNIFVNREIAEKKFTCDLDKCKGACCTMESKYGAPVYRAEIDEISKILDIVTEYLPAHHQEAIQKNGFWEIKENQELLKSINDRDCVFVYYENDIAKCALEKAYFDNKIDFRKPISCHLFPIRVRDFGGLVLKYERYSECSPAEKLGKETGLSVLEFCKDSLERAFGAEWLEELKNKIKED